MFKFNDLAILWFCELWNDLTSKLKKSDKKLKVVLNNLPKFCEEGMNFFFVWQGAGLYSRSIKKVEDDIQGALKKVNELTGKHKPFYSKKHS